MVKEEKRKTRKILRRNRMLLRAIGQGGALQPGLQDAAWHLVGSSLVPRWPLKTSGNVATWYLVGAWLDGALRLVVLLLLHAGLLSLLRLVAQVFTPSDFTCGARSPCLVKP